MAKAVFHKHQRVFVRPVGTWALIEQVKPQWVKGVEEPVKVFYDCALGRDFTAGELSAEETVESDSGHWRLMRLKNKWQSAEECTHHPFPGTYPVVVTDQNDWGGWRVPGAEYDREPKRIESQARLIAAAPRLLAIAEQLARNAADNPEAGEDLLALARQARDIVRTVRNQPESEPEAEHSSAVESHRLTG